MSSQTQEIEIRRNPDLAQGYQDYRLPCLDSYTEQKVVHAINELYKGYTPPEAESIKTLDQVVAYVMERERVHGDTMGKIVTGATKTRGVINACRWDLGHIIDVAMHNSEFGESVAPALASALGITEQEVQAFRQVHTSMTRVEAYVLGLYGVSISTTMRIAAIPDEATRKKIISECCNSGISVMDAQAVNRMRNRLYNAIRVALLPTTGDLLEAETVDPDSEGAPDNTPVISAQEDELAKLLKTVEKITSDMKPWRNSRVERDCELLSAYDPSRLDLGSETIMALNEKFHESLIIAAKELNEAEDYIRALRESVDSTIAVFGDDSEEGSGTDPQA